MLPLFSYVVEVCGGMASEVGCIITLCGVLSSGVGVICKQDLVESSSKDSAPRFEPEECDNTCAHVMLSAANALRDDGYQKHPEWYMCSMGAQNAT